MKAKVNISAPSLYNFFTLQLDNALQSSQNVPQVHQPCRLPGIYSACISTRGTLWGIMSCYMEKIKQWVRCSMLAIMLYLIPIWNLLGSRATVTLQPRQGNHHCGLLETTSEACFLTGIDMTPIDPCRVQDLYYWTLDLVFSIQENKKHWKCKKM